MEYSYIRSCRLCDAPRLIDRLSLVSTPPANEFVGSPGEQDTFPLKVNQCQDCGHIQLSVAVNPERLFRNYVYVSGTSPVFVQHFSDYADSMMSKGYVSPSDVIIEIGSNDGTLLNQFKKRGCEKVWGFEPATKIATQAWMNHKVVTIPDFFTHRTYQILSASVCAAPQLIIANNVFAHMESLTSTTELISEILSPTGVFVFEVSYFQNVHKDIFFDTIYHEHLDYHTVYPLCRFFESFGLRLFDVELINTHGGSIRCHVDRGVRPVLDSVRTLVSDERECGLTPDTHKFETGYAFECMRVSIDKHKDALTRKIREIQDAGKKIIGYGAPAKATTLMHEFGIGRDQISHIVDDSPWKQGLFSPGKNIPIVDSASLQSLDYDYILIMAWNFHESIIRKYQGRDTHFLIPLPRLLEAEWKLGNTYWL